MLFEESGWDFVRDAEIDKILQSYDMLTCSNLIFLKSSNTVKIIGLVILDGINVACLQCKDYKAVWKKELVQHCHKWHDCHVYDLKQLTKISKAESYTNKSTKR
jgi:hypothetical protein